MGRHAPCCYVAVHESAARVRLLARTPRHLVTPAGNPYAGRGALLIAPASARWPEDLRVALVARGWRVARRDDLFGVSLLLTVLGVDALVADPEALDETWPRRRDAYAETHPRLHIVLTDSLVPVAELAADLIARFPGA